MRNSQKKSLVIVLLSCQLHNVHLSCSQLLRKWCSWLNAAKWLNWWKWIG